MIEEVKGKVATESDEPVPKEKPQTVAAEVKRHVVNWSEIYVWLPLAMMFVPALAYAAYLLSGRAPRMSLDFLPELAINNVKIVLSIIWVSVCRQAFGHWYTKEEALAHPIRSFGQSIITLVIFLALLYTLFNR